MSQFRTGKVLGCSLSVGAGYLIGAMITDTPQMTVFSNWFCATGALVVYEWLYAHD